MIFYDSLMLNAKFSFAAAERFRGENAGKALCTSTKRFADCIFSKIIPKMRAQILKGICWTKLKKIARETNELAG